MMKKIIIQGAENFFINLTRHSLEKATLCNEVQIIVDLNLEDSFDFAFLPLSVKYNKELKEKLLPFDKKIVLYEIVDSLISFVDLKGKFLLHNANIERNIRDKFGYNGKTQRDNRFLYINDFNSCNGANVLRNILYLNRAKT